MTWSEIFRAYVLGPAGVGLMGPTLGAVLALFFWCWRRYRGEGEHTIAQDALRVGGAVIPIAVGALLAGQDWYIVLGVCLSAFGTALGFNSTALPTLINPQTVVALIGKAGLDPKAVLDEIAKLVDTHGKTTPKA